MSLTLSVILVNHNERDYLWSVLTALAEEFPADATEVIVVDNHSHDDSAAMVRRDFPAVDLIASPTNLLYGKGNNLGLARATADWVMILNPDVSWVSGQLRRLVESAKRRPGLDLAAPHLRYRDGRTQISVHRRFPNVWTVFVDYCLPLQQILMKLGQHPYQFSAADHQTTRVIAHATGACLLVRREVIREIGTFDPSFSMYLEETDWQARMAKAGFQSWLIADAELTHFGSAQKSFAQASPHYLWGLRRYAEKHWSARDRLRLPAEGLIATVISLLFLGLLFLPSFFLRTNGVRLRHYLKVYSQLLLRLLYWPNTTPQT